MKKILLTTLLSITTSLVYANGEDFIRLKCAAIKKTTEQKKELIAYFSPDYSTASKNLNTYCIKNGYTIIGEVESKSYFQSSVADRLSWKTDGTIEVIDAMIQK